MVARRRDPPTAAASRLARRGGGSPRSKTSARPTGPSCATTWSRSPTTRLPRCLAATHALETFPTRSSRQMTASTLSTHLHRRPTLRPAQAVWRSPSPPSSRSWASGSSIRSCPPSPRTSTPRRARSSSCSPATSPSPASRCSSRARSRAASARSARCCRPRAHHRVPALAGASNSIGAIVGLRAGWGLGNALFIATALSVIIGSASGGVAGAVILYEAALGLGISVGPLLGGELGAISWRGPFFGVAVLMTIGFVATAVFLDRSRRRGGKRVWRSSRSARCALARSAQRPDRRLLQLRLLHPPRTRRWPWALAPTARLRVLRLGPDARGVRGLRRARARARRRRARPRRARSSGSRPPRRRWACCTLAEALIVGVIVADVPRRHQPS